MHPARPTPLRGRVFRGRDAVAAGLLTRRQLSSRAWRRLYRGVYADAGLPHDHAVALAGAALLVPSSAAFSGRSAAFLLGAETLVDDGMPVEVTVPEGDRFGPVTGLRIRRSPLPPSSVRTAGRYRCTTPLRTALDIARSELRVLLRLAGLTPVPQFVVRDADGRFLARVDLAFVAERVAVEYDGAWHGQPGQLARDRRRSNGLVAAGWRVVHVTAADMHRPDTILVTIRAVLAERGDRHA